MNYEVEDYLLIESNNLGMALSKILSESDLKKVKNKVLDIINQNEVNVFLNTITDICNENEIKVRKKFVDMLNKNSYLLGDVAYNFIMGLGNENKLYI